MVMDLDERVEKTKGNIKVIDDLMLTWIEKPMFTRMEVGKTEGNSKKDNLLDIGGKHMKMR